MEPTTNNNVRDALKERDGFHIWWRMIRPHTLTASFIPVFVGTMAAWVEGSINWNIFLAMLLASIFIQTATNLFNEYYDFKRGLDNEESVGIGGSIVRDGIKPNTIKNLAFFLYFISLIIGIYICIASSWWIAVIGLVCMAFGYLYTGGPIPISYTPFGELASGFLMGTVIIGISYFIQTGTLTSSVILISIPIMILIGTINMANNIRDRDGDEIGGRKTIPVLIGREKAITFMAILFIIVFGLTGLYIIVGILPLWSLLTFLAIFKARAVIKNFRGKTAAIEMMPAMKATGITNTIYGFLLGISLLLSHFI
ncbi:1,4-dihydroxy-2-naphthoate polyprenyltransferase [Oceanobacillus piezotolerans]|uniref:1,4-dihydroxy-2-naphthoate octaprenyltransferase n=1 Tax=Oceanobacillus piezotolerans TaxID=2448030 RepID=A0A498D725_9BACI|nr:1,4-dihydroxy-2-naphthoate polyprenyltransferase [Oceanobacillus piezotolerans]RLL46475.1 1,4-dihydroxy-2-naphthoate polyprenyltransferase [Oceanobacillus piezotolerans]